MLPAEPQPQFPARNEGSEEAIAGDGLTGIEWLENCSQNLDAADALYERTKIKADELRSRMNDL